MECTKLNCPMQVGTVIENCGDSCPWRTTVKRADLISRDDYRKILDEQLWHYDDGTNPFHMQILKLQREILDDMPAVDAAPVVHGRWEVCGDCGITRCSACKWNFESRIDYKYCPNCGAKMDSDSKNA